MKGQTQQVFIYIMVILVVGAVLLFGYKAIDNLLKKGCELDKVTFQSQLKDTIDSNTDYGTINPVSISAPCGYEKLCIIDPERINNNPGYVTGPISVENNKLMFNEIAAGTGNNVFLIKGKDTIPLYSLDMITVKDLPNQYGYICVKAKGGKFYLQLEGIGRGKVQISEGS